MAVILVFDKQLDSYTLLRRVLEKLGHEVVDGEQITCLAEFGTLRCVDMAIIDINVGHKASENLAVRLRQIWPSIKTLAITNFASEAADRSLWNEILLKPIDIEMLEFKVQKLLNCHFQKNSDMSKSKHV